MAAILLVEDTPEIARLVVRALAAEGLDVEVAVDGQSGLDSVRDRQPRAILLDLMLPDIDGTEVCRRIRTMERELGRRPVPIMMLTALTAETDRAAGVDAGADDYLAKPFALGELVARIRALLARADGERGG